MDELEILLEEIRDLCEVPEFQRAIEHKVSELKFNLSAWISEYREVENMIRDIPGTKEPGEAQKINGYIFELKRMGKKLWIPSLPGYSEIDGCDRFVLDAVLPREIIDFIVGHAAQRGISVMLRGLTLPDLEGRKFDLIFEKQGSKHYRGIIHEHGGVKKTVKCKAPDSIRNLAPGDLKLLITYFKKHPHYFFQVFNSFLKTWKPMLDKLSQDDGRMGSGSGSG